MPTKVGYQGRIGAHLHDPLVPIVPTDPVAAYVELETVRDVTINLEANEVDDTSRITNGWRSRIQGLNQWGLSFEMIYDPTNVGWETVRDAFLNHDLLDIRALDLDFDVITAAQGPAEGIAGVCSVTGFEKGEPLEEAQTSSVVLIGSGEPAWIEVAGQVV